MSNQQFITLYRNVRGSIKVTKSSVAQNTKVEFIDKIPLTIDNQFILDKWVAFTSVDANPVKSFLHWLSDPNNKTIAEKILRIFRILGDIYLVNSKHPAVKMFYQFIEEIRRNNWENIKYLTEECAKGNMLKEPIIMLLEYNDSQYQNHKDEYLRMCIKLNAKPLDHTGTKFVQHFTNLRILEKENTYDMSKGLNAFDQYIENNIEISKLTVVNQKEIENKDTNMPKGVNSTYMDKRALGVLRGSPNARPKAESDPLEPTDHEVEILGERIDPKKGHELLIQGTTSLHTKKEIKEFEQQGYVVHSMAKTKNRKWQVVWKDSWVSAKYIYLEQLRDGVASNNAE
jgi:hypothetical protein